MPSDGISAQTEVLTVEIALIGCKVGLIINRRVSIEGERERLLYFYRGGVILMSGKSEGIAEGEIGGEGVIIIEASSKYRSRSCDCFCKDI